MARKHELAFGLPVVAMATFAMPYVLKFVGLDVLKFTMFSPMYVVPACVLFFFIETIRVRANVKEAAMPFILALVVWAAIGMGLAFIGVVIMTVATGSPQGPLALIFYGPGGLAVGAIVGTGIWRIKGVKPNLPLHDGPAASGRPMS